MNQLIFKTKTMLQHHVKLSKQYNDFKGDDDLKH